MQYETCSFDIDLPIVPAALVEQALEPIVNQATGNHEVGFRTAGNGRSVLKLICKETNGDPDVIVYLTMSFLMGDDLVLRAEMHHELHEGDGTDADASWA